MIFRRKPEGKHLRQVTVDYLQHEFALGIQCNVIPVVAATSVSGIVFGALFFLLVNEVPLLAELYFRGGGGKTPRVHRGLPRRVRPQVACNESRYRHQHLTSDPFSACHCLRRRVRQWKQLCPWAGGSRKKSCHGVPPGIGTR